MHKYEIHDDKGCLYEGNLTEIMNIWGILWDYLDKDYCKKSKGKIPFQKWMGSLQIIAVLERKYLRKGIHSVKSVASSRNKNKCPLEEALKKRNNKISSI